jgi:hypothetical protein
MLVLMMIALRTLVLLQMVHLARVAFGVGRGDDRWLRGGGVHLGLGRKNTARTEITEMSIVQERIYKNREEQ